MEGTGNYPWSRVVSSTPNSSQKADQVPSGYWNRPMSSSQSSSQELDSGDFESDTSSTSSNSTFSSMEIDLGEIDDTDEFLEQIPIKLCEIPNSEDNTVSINSKNYTLEEIVKKIETIVNSGKLRMPEPAHENAETAIVNLLHVCNEKKEQNLVNSLLALQEKLQQPSSLYSNVLINRLEAEKRESKELAKQKLRKSLTPPEPPFSEQKRDRLDRFISAHFGPNLGKSSQFEEEETPYLRRDRMIYSSPVNDYLVEDTNPYSQYSQGSDLGISELAQEPQSPLARTDLRKSRKKRDRKSSTSN